MKNAKHIFTTICLLVALTVAASLLAMALADSEPMLDIKYCNVSLDDGVAFWYSVSGENIPADAEVGITVRKNSPSSGEILTAELKQKNVISSGTQYIFSVDGLSLDEMTVELYATPYVKLASGEMIYGEAKKSSVLEYAYRVLGRVGNGSYTVDNKKAVEEMLVLGADAQESSGKNTDRLATDEYSLVRVVDGGISDDGFAKKLCKVGETVTLVANEMDNKRVVGWKDSTGTDVGTDSTIEVTVGTKNATYYVVYGGLLRSISYNANGGVMPDSYVTEYEEGKTVELPSPTMSGYVFSGWHVSSDLSQEGQLRRITATTSGDLMLHAKWSKVIYDHTPHFLATPTSELTYIASDGNKFELNEELGALEWYQDTAKASQIGFLGNLKNDLEGSKIFTVSFTLSKHGTSDIPVGQFRLRRRADNMSIFLFRTEANGLITLGNDTSAVITALSEKPTTFEIVVDFESKKFSAYDERGVKVAETDMSLPSGETKYTNLDDWYNALTQYRWQWYSMASSSSGVQRIRIHSIAFYMGNSVIESEGDGYSEEELTVMRNELLSNIEAQRKELDCVYDYYSIESGTPKKYLFADYTKDISSLLSAANKEKWGTAPTTPIDEHPRLLFTKGDIPSIREALEAQNGSNDLFFKYVNTEVSGILSAVGAYVPGSEKNVFNYNQNTIEHILSKALAYQLYGDDTYGYQAIYAMKNFIKTLDIVYVNSDQCRLYGHVMFAAACVYDWCYDLLSEMDKTQFIAGVENCLCRGYIAKGMKMEQGFPPTGHSSFVGHGAEYNFLRDYLSFSLAIYDENPSWWSYIAARFYNDYVPSRNVYFVTGLAPQGTNYVGFRHLPNLFSAWIVTVGTNGGENPYVNLDETIPSFISYEFAPGYIFSDGDGTVNAQTKVLRDHTFISAMLFGDATMLAQGEYLLGDGKYAGASQGLTLVPYIIARGRTSVEPAENRYEGLDLIHYNGTHLGQYVVREAFGVDDSAAVFMKLKQRTSANHEHADAGSFQIYYKGLLTGDSGVYNNANHVHSKYFNKATVAHNGVLIYDANLADTCEGWYTGSQRINLRSPSTAEEWLTVTYDTGTITGRQHAYSDAEEKDPLYAYIGGDITKAYYDYQASYVGRRMLTVYTGNEDFPMVFFVYDDVESAQSTTQKSQGKHSDKKFVLQINSPEEPTVDSAAGRIITENGDGRLVLASLSDNVRFDSLGGRAYKTDGSYDAENSRNFLINGKQCITLDKKDDGHWGRIEIVYTKNTAKATFMNLIYVTDKGQTKAEPAISRVTGTGVTGGVFGDVAAIFMTSRERVSTTVTAEVSGSGTVNYYVSGVSAGTWSITVDGKAYGVATATEEGGLLTFSAPAGELTLTRK